MYHGNTPLSRPTQARDPQDQTKTPRGRPVMHTLTNCEMHNYQCLRMKEERLTLYIFMLLYRLIQQGPYPHPSTQGEDAGMYCPKAHYQRKQNYCRFQRVCPNPLPGRPPGHISPIICYRFP